MAYIVVRHGAVLFLAIAQGRVCDDDTPLLKNLVCEPLSSAATIANILQKQPNGLALFGK